MPNTKSAEKALRQSQKRRVKNLAKTNAYKNAVKQFKKYIAAGNIEEAKKLLPKVYKKLDKAAKAGVIKRNKTSRLKSRMSHLLGTK
ncbi:MAG: 30S ribosomal protein S20 [Patescibacteria group bacterium]